MSIWRQFNSLALNGRQIIWMINITYKKVQSKKMNSTNRDDSLLPPGICPLGTQVAGHMFQTDSNLLGILKEADKDTILKPLGKPMCGAREIKFYESLKNSINMNLIELSKFVPKYKGIRKISIGGNETDFIELEDLNYGLLEPCIMDIKIGKRTWDPTASREKIAAEEKKYAACKQNLGICIPGFQVMDIQTGELKRFEKSFGKELNENTIRKAILMFLNCDKIFCRILVTNILAELVQIEKWFAVQTTLNFYSSSILIIYDCHVLKSLLENDKNKLSYREHSNGLVVNTLNQECSDENIKSNIWSNNSSLQSWIRVKMIDFAHVFPSQERSLDINYLFGIQNLIKILETFINELS